MSAAARGAAGFLCYSGRLRPTPEQKEMRAAQRSAERPAKEMRKEREAKRFSTAPERSRRR